MGVELERRMQFRSLADRLRAAPVPSFVSYHCHLLSR